MAADQPTILATSSGFAPEPDDPTNMSNIKPSKVFALAAELAHAGEHPRVCMINTAGGEDPARTATMHNAFSKADMISSHLDLFVMPNWKDMRGHLLSQDIIWVGGGSTANLLALWRLHGIDVILRECWDAGVVLAGVSAGAICWHIGGTTDSFGLPLQPVTNGLAFLPYSHSPHYDAEAERRPLTQRLIAEGVLPDGYATDNGTGILFFGTDLQYGFTEVEGKKTWFISRTGDGDGDGAVEIEVETRAL
ncbi:MAG TPA: peptidase E [Acidimicrobiales bacterium]|jgi:peptidase E